MYILIIMLFHINSISQQHIEFHSKETCQSAMFSIQNHLIKANQSSVIDSWTIGCVEK